MRFETYANKPNRSIRIHIVGCRCLRVHGGHHTYDQGWYRKHKTYGDAWSYAQSTGLDVFDCKVCSPGSPPKPSILPKTEKVS